MSSVIAIVKSIVGQVYAMSPEGFQRLIVEGDRLFKGDQLLTGNEGMATLELTDGRTVDLGRDSQWSDTDAVAAADAPPAQPATQTPADGVAQLQKAIEAGVDPTKELEATAAGPGAGGASGGGGAGGGHSFVMLDATAANVDPTIGFATDAAPLTTEALDEEEALPLDAAQPQDSLPSETVPVPDGPNSSPQGQGASITTDEDTPVQGQLSANDPDGDTLTYSLDSGPRNGTLVINPDGSYTYTPNSNFNGSDSFTAIVDDGKGGTDTITVSIGVNPVNHAPAAANDGPVSVTEDTPASGNVLSNDSDADGDGLTVTQFTVGGSTYQAGQTAVINGVGSLVINGDGAYTFTPAPNYTGAVPTATYTVSDGSLTDSGELSFADVSPVNDAPAAANDGPVAVTEDTPASGNVLANDTDADGDSLTVTQFTVGASTYQAGQTAVINGVGSLVINSDGAYTFTPAPNYTGPVPSAIYTVSDGQLTDTAELNFGNVAPLNDAPETAAASGSGNEDAAIIPVALSGSDLDGTVDHFVIKSLPANGALLLNGVALAIGDSIPATGNGASITFVPNTSWNGSTTFEYTSVDNQGLQDSSAATGTITVASVNDAPETAAASGSGNEDNLISVNLSGSDSDGAIDHFVIKSLPTDGTLMLNGVALAIGDSVPATGNGASITFVPNANWNGTTSFQYASVDNQGLEDSSPATGTITVASINDAPETATTSGTGNEDSAGIPVALSGSDVDGSVDHFVIKSLPANGTLLLNGVALAIGDSVPATGNGASITFVPNANWNGSTSFQYASVDNAGLEDSTPATGTITVASVNNAPETATTSGTGNEDSAGIPV
ncbi:retention module-containing protein, partial [Pseudomonas sp. BN417]|uniref:retention module-containing protein n=1 Tax=Pseudomonas sp. BN417 TaxID=2567890 RepID=UPI00245902A4